MNGKTVYRNNLISKITLGTLLVIFLYIVYLSIFPFKVLEIEGPMKVLNSPVKVGEYLKLNIKYCKFVEHPCTVTNRLVNGIVYTLPDMTLNNKKGCYDINVLSLRIPKDIPPGKYILQRSAYYELNIFHHKTIHYESEEFEII